MKVIKFFILIIIIFSFLRLNPQLVGLSSEYQTSVCDKAYVQEMQASLAELKNILRIDLMKQAEQYMIMLKQKEDLEYQIRTMDQRMFDTATSALLRRPLESYNRCKNALRTQTQPE